MRRKGQRRLNVILRCANGGQQTDDKRVKVETYNVNLVILHIVELDVVVVLLGGEETASAPNSATARQQNSNEPLRDRTYPSR